MIDIVKLKIKNTLTDDEIVKLNNIITEKLISISNLKKYIKDNEYILNLTNLVNYLEFRKKYKFVSSTKEFFIAKYGLENGLIKYNENKVKFKNKLTPYKIEYWLKRGFSENDSIKEIEKFKRNKSTSKYGFILRHGVEKGLELFNNFKNTSKHTENKYIEKYGEKEGLKKWNDYTTKKREKSVFTALYWINKGYSKEESEFLRQEFHKMNLNTSSVTYWISKGLTENEAIDKITNIYLKRRVLFTKASKESLNKFSKILKFLNTNNITYKIGVKGNNEFSIYDKENKKLNFYDLTIPSLKLIIEYNGERFHPNPNKLTKEEWKEWKAYRFEKNITNEICLDADTIYKNDLYKIKLAESNGYEVFTVWSSDNKDKISEKIINIIKTKIKYENS
jgi:hypothetical protein